MDYLEQLAGEWYEYQGYFVRRKLGIGLRADGSYECELDLVAFHPQKRHVVLVETCINVLEWNDREALFRTRFQTGQQCVRRLFGSDPLVDLERIALIAADEAPARHRIAGARIVLLPELLSDIYASLASFHVSASMMPTRWPLLRTLELAAEHRDRILLPSTGESLS